MLRGRCPPTEGPVPAPIPPLVATFALRSEVFRTPRPMVAVGIVANSSLVRVWVRFVLVVSSATPATALTSMFWLLLDTDKTRGAVDVLLMSMRKPVSL